MEGGRRTRVLAIGLDAASEPIVDLLVDEGRMPNVGRLRAGSARWDIDGGTACYRNLQWPQFTFSRRFEVDRGDLFAFDPATYRTYLVDARQPLRDGSRAFWDRPDLRTITFDVPETALVPGYAAVAGWGGHAPRGPRSSSPPGLVDELDRAVGAHRGFGNDYDSIWHDPAATDALADALVDGVGRRGRALEHLLQRFPDWDLVIAVVSELHSAGHLWAHALDPSHALHGAANTARAAEALQRVDAAVGVMVDAAPAGTAVVLFSPDDISARHADCPSLVLLPELLQRMHDGEGLLERSDPEAWRAAGHPPLVPTPPFHWRDHVDGQLRQPPPRRWRDRSAAYRRVRRSRPVEAVVERLRGRPIGPQGRLIPPEAPTLPPGGDPARFDTNELLFTTHYQPHWSSMRAFALPGYTSGGVRINVVGRERSGVVPIEEYHAVCDEIEAEVRACRNPRTGNPVVDSVLRPRAGDPLASDGDAYDLVFTWAPELIDAFEHPRHGLIGPVPAHRSGVHGTTAFLYVHHDDVTPGEHGSRPAWDIPATLIALTGAAPTPGTEGTSMVPPSPSAADARA
jgi:hypothetical protein